MMSYTEEEAAKIIQRCWRAKILTTPCFCDFFRNEDNLAWPSERYGDRCLTCDSLECYEGYGGNVHFVCDLSRQTSYSWSCRPLTRQDVYDKKIQLLEYPHPGAEGSDHMSGPVDMYGPVYDGEEVDETYIGG